MPMPRRRASAELRSSTFRPFHRTSPSCGWSMPNRIFIRVDLPAPFSPTTAWMVFFSTARLTSRLATTPFS